MADTKAAIGYTYDDSTPVDKGYKKKKQEEEQEEEKEAEEENESESSDEEMDLGENMLEHTTSPRAFTVVRLLLTGDPFP